MTGSVAVLGIAVMDVIAYAERQPRPGETLLGDGYEITAGGKGLNQAIAAARAGARTAMIASIGDDTFGRELHAALSDEGVDTAAVAVRPDLATGVGMPVVSRSGENAIVVVPGASSHIGPSHHDWIASNVGSETVFLSQLELPAQIVAEAARSVSRLGARIVLNPAPAAGSARDLVPYVDVLVPNEVEAASLTGDDDPLRAARTMVSWKEGLVAIVTCGSEGIVIADSTGERRVPAPVVRAVDTVGAGDVFCGYLAAGLANGETVVEAATRAVEAASVSVTRKGGARSAPTMDELRRG